ncbi:MAG: hypothetical protein Q9167_006902 [Letrouitia subvulpina]
MDRQRQGHLVETNFSTTDSNNAIATIRQWLLSATVISTEEAQVVQLQGATEDIDRQVFRSIGIGMCAEVFHQPGTDVVLKRAFRPLEGQLWNDYEWHRKIYEGVTHTFDHSWRLLAIAKPYRYLRTQVDEERRARNRVKWPPILRETTELLEAQLIPSLPEDVRYAIVDRYCPPYQQEAAKNDPANRDCLVRVYLGRRCGNHQAKPDRFSLRNFEADLKVFGELGLSTETYSYAKMMAIALAELHWSVGANAAGVEFVLGGANLSRTLVDLKEQEQELPPHSTTGGKSRAAHLWLLDFNQCGEIENDKAGVQNAVEAFWQNEPYYPRPVPVGHPDADLWEAFKEEYLTQSHKITQGFDEPAIAFIDGVVAEAQKREMTGSAAKSTGRKKKSRRGMRGGKCRRKWKKNSSDMPSLLQDED